MTYTTTCTTLSCAQSFRRVVVVLVLTVIKDTNGFPTQPASGKLRQDEDYPFDIMYDWIDRNSMPKVSETEPFPSPQMAPGRFVNENDDLSSPFDIFDTETRGKEWKRINELFQRHPGHSDLKITPNKRSELRKTCLQGHRFRPWLKNLCNKL